MFSNGNRLIKDIISILIFSAVIAIIANLINPRGFTLVSNDFIKNKKIVHISIKEARIKYSSKLAVFVDSRVINDFRKNHIKGAINIPANPESISLKKIRSYFKILNRQKELVIYCGGLSCGTSELLARRIIGMGYSRHIYIIKEGFPAWLKSGYTVEK
ncbi:rhodanese-like domain-containing protein [Spirochaetota bacterium]